MVRHALRIGLASGCITIVPTSCLLPVVYTYCLIHSPMKRESQPFKAPELLLCALVSKGNASTCPMEEYIRIFFNRPSYNIMSIDGSNCMIKISSPLFKLQISASFDCNLWLPVYHQYWHCSIMGEVDFAVAIPVMHLLHNFYELYVGVLYCTHFMNTFL